ncbi:MAG: aldehyde dehydrogenase family protein, partial [Brevibacterium aurantiacum]
MLVDVLVEAGLPAGVLNVVTSESARRVVTPWMESGIARKVTFTGSTEVGIGLLKQAADNVMKTSMELGGNAPFVVCDDADIDKAVTGAVQAKMRNGGEACTSANRLFVHSSIAEEFSTTLTERIGSMTVGNGLDEGTEVGPLVDQDSLDKVASLVDDAVSKGAKVLTGGSKIEGKGFFYSPTVMTDVPLDSEIRTTEIFGPVAPIVTFDTDEEGIALANETEFGLAGYLFSENVERALNLADKMQVGMVGLNTGLVSNPAAPFGGVKKSGLGREGGSVGIEEFLEVKYVALPRA